MKETIKERIIEELATQQILRDISTGEIEGERFPPSWYHEARVLSEGIRTEIRAIREREE